MCRDDVESFWMTLKTLKYIRWWDGCVQPLGRIATLLVLVSVHVWSVWILMKMDHLEDSFDLLILITSNW